MGTRRTASFLGCCAGLFSSFACVGDDPTVAGSGTGDGGAPDAVSIDATPDAGHGDGDGGEPDASATFCSQGAHDACFDFDRSDDVTSGWDAFATTNGCTYGVTSGDYKSKPHAARLSCGDEPGAKKANIVKRIDGTGKSGVHLEFDLKLDGGKMPSGQFLYFLAIYENDDDYVFTLGRGVDGWFMLNSADGSYPLTGAPPENAWAHVVVDVTFHATSGVVKMSFDGTPVLDRTNVKTTLVASHTTMSVQLGPFAESDSPGTKMLVDNVVIDGT